MANVLLRNSIFTLGLFTVLSVGISKPAQAFFLVQEQSQEEIGGILNFEFVIPDNGHPYNLTSYLALSNASGSTFDLTTGVAEYFDVSIEGTHLGRYSCTDNPVGAIAMSCGGPNNLNTFAQYIWLEGDQVNDWVSDGLLNLTVDFGDGVDIRRGGNNPNTLVALIDFDDPSRTPRLPAPTAVLPVLGGLFSAAKRRQSHE